MKTNKLNILTTLAIGTTICGVSNFCILTASCSAGGNTQNSQWNCGASFLIDDQSVLPEHEFHLNDDLTMPSQDKEYARSFINQKNILNALVYTALIPPDGRKNSPAHSDKSLINSAGSAADILSYPASITTIRNGVEMSIKSMQNDDVNHYVFVATQVTTNSFDILSQTWVERDPSEVTTVEWTGASVETCAMYGGGSGYRNGMAPTSELTDEIWVISLNGSNVLEKPILELSTYDTKNFINYWIYSDFQYDAWDMEAFYNDKQYPLSPLQLSEAEEPEGGPNTEKLISAVKSQNLINGLANDCESYLQGFFSFDSKTDETFLAYFLYEDDYSEDGFKFEYINCSDLNNGVFKYEDAIQNGAYSHEESSCTIIGSYVYSASDIWLNIQQTFPDDEDPHELSWSLAPCDLVNVTIV